MSNPYKEMMEDIKDIKANLSDVKRMLTILHAKDITRKTMQKIQGGIK